MIPRRTLAYALVPFVAACLLSFSPAAAQKSPDEELASLRAPEGMEVSLFAAEPLITNPAAIDVDTHGRVWVAEIQWYRSQAKQPPADKIKVLEDTDGDGRADKVTTFAEGLFAPMSICVAGDKVYVATSPDLWVYEDKNGDLKADGPPTKLLTGFGGHNHDHGSHSIVLGPDHKWWMAHGDEGFDVTGTDGSHIKFQFGAVLRGELDGSKLETVAVNFRNIYEVCVSSFGEAFLTDNDNDGNESVRVCWILDGGDYGWFGRPPFDRRELDAQVPVGTPYREAWHFRGYQPGFVPGTLVTGFGSPCGICFYEGDAFGESLKNMPLHCDAGPREVRKYPHQSHGFGMTAQTENILTTDGDPYFRPDDICTGPSGELYVSDWYDGGVGGHAYNDPDHGRIFVLKPKDKKLAPVSPAGPYATIDEAIAGLKSPNLATQYLARERLLAEGEKSVPALTALLRDGEPDFRARALWVLDRIGGDARRLVVRHLRHTDADLRALAVRILRRHGDQYATEIIALVDDGSPAVRREVALMIPQMPDGMAQRAWLRLAKRFDGTDRYELETLNIAGGKRKAELFNIWSEQVRPEQLALAQLLDAEAATAMVNRLLASTELTAEQRQKLFDQLAFNSSLAAGEAVLKTALDDHADAALRGRAWQILATHLSGNWRDLAQREELRSGLRALLAQPDTQPLALDLITRNELRDLAGDVLQLLADDSQSLEIRQAAIQAAVQLHAEGVRAALQGILTSKDERLHEDAMRALVELQDWGAFSELLLGKDHALEERAALTGRLMSSTNGAYFMLRMLDEKSLPEDLREQVLQLATNHPDINVRVLFEKYLPEDKLPERLGDKVKPEEILALAGEAARGERIFFESSAAQCKSCHAVQGKGSNVGPELSQIGRKYAREALLETILLPSKAIAPEFYPYTVETESGQVLVGFVLEKNDHEVVFKEANGNVFRLPAKEISVLERREQSLMPELVLRDVSAQDAADLLAYLMTLGAGEGK
jgi:putative membrane-bound dehydrogenase-like protein